MLPLLFVNHITATPTQLGRTHFQWRRKCQASIWFGGGASRSGVAGRYFLVLFPAGAINIDTCMCTLYMCIYIYV